MKRLIRKWEGATSYRRLSKNFAWVFSSHMLTGLISVASLALMARALGPAGLGTIAIIQAYTKIMERLLHLECWQTVIKFGIEALERNETQRFTRLLKFSFAFDLVGSLLAGLCAFFLAPILARLAGLDGEGQALAQLLSLSLLVTLRPTGLAILRIYDRFDLLAKIDVAVAIFRLVLSAAAFSLELGIQAFVAILLLENILNGLGAFIIAAIILPRKIARQSVGVSLRGVASENPAIFRVLWNANVNVILRQSTQRLDVIILGALANQQTVGEFFLARRVAETFLKIARPISQAIYPEIMRKWAEGNFEEFRSILRTVGIFLVLFCAFLYIPLVMLMPKLLELGFGTAFSDAALLANIQILAVMVYLCSIILTPALLSAGMDRALARTTVSAALLFYLLIFPLTHFFGAVGTASSHLAFNVFWFAAATIALGRALQDAAIARPAQ